MQKYYQSLSYQQGFSLLELAMVLAILGVLGGLSLPLIQTQMQRSKTNHTIEHQEAVMTALGHYVSRTNQMPCPAKDHNGEAAKKCTPQSIGYVPYKALGLSKEMASDGYKRPMFFAVEPDLTAIQYCHEGGSHDHLKVLDAQKKSVIATSQGDYVAAVVLSLGESVHGSQSADEKTNAEMSLTFIDRPYSAHQDNLFRQKVKWASHQNLIGYYGKSACPKGSQPSNEAGIKRGESRQGGYAHLILDY